MENSRFTSTSSSVNRPSAFSDGSSLIASFEDTSDPVIIVIDEEQDRNRNFSANIFVVPLGEPTTSSSGRISMSSRDMGSLVLDVDDSDPESECTCTIECWVLDCDASNTPKTKVTLCPRCAEKAKKQHTTTLAFGEFGAALSSGAHAFESRRDLLSYYRKRTKLLLRRKQGISSTRQFKCLKCHKMFPDVERLCKHNSQHKRKKHFSCPNCSKIFQLRQSAAMHILREHISC